MMKDPREARLENDLLSFLSAAGRTVSAGAAAFVLKADPATVESVLEELRRSGRVLSEPGSGPPGWMLSGDGIPESGGSLQEVFFERLKEYVLFSREATLHDRAALVSTGRLSSRDRCLVLIEALRHAGERGEFGLCSFFLNELTSLAGEDLREREISLVLNALEPRKLRNLSVDASADFVRSVLPRLKEPSDRALALTRLAELELLENRASEAEERIERALETAMESGSPDVVPAALECIAEIPRDFEAMEKTAGRLEGVLQWAEGLDDVEAAARIRASAAVAYAALRMNSAAGISILSAMSDIASLSLESQLAVEWARARVCMAAGRNRKAMQVLERSLLLAESVRDQFSVMEILGAMVNRMKERPGHTARDLISMMRNVAKNAELSNSLSTRLYTLDRLACLYTGTLQLNSAVETMGLVRLTTGSSGAIREEPLSGWCRAYIGFLTGRDDLLSSGDHLLPGAGEFLRALAADTEPDSGPPVADGLPREGDTAEHSLVLAMEAFAAGRGGPASAIAAVLDTCQPGSREDPFLVWKLCISGILASGEVHADDFFRSAQVLARQFDRLLMVWLILRCRERLDIGRSRSRQAELLLLLAELDEYVSDQLEGNAAVCFAERTGSARRRAELEGLSGLPGGSLRDIRDRIAEELSKGPDDPFSRVEGKASRIQDRSEISAALELTGRLLEADRVMALRIVDGKVEIIEGCGEGRWRPPGEEAAGTVLEAFEDSVEEDCFGRGPFGSRRRLAIPLRRSVLKPQKRTASPAGSTDGNLLLIESESPFGMPGRMPSFLLDSLCRQIGAELLLRTRESTACMDGMTGAMAGGSWMQRLRESMAGDRQDTLSVLLVDVDGLAEINRVFGHRMGDISLRTVVSAIREVLRPNDTVGRLRGDMFGVILPDAADEEPVRIGERICSSVAWTDVRPDRVPVTVSVGAASVTSGTDTPEDVIGRAVEALLAASDGAGNSVLAWSPSIDPLRPGRSEFFETGDPGWDHEVRGAVLEMLTCGDPDLDRIAGRVRDVLRSEFLSIEDGEGSICRVGSRVLRAIPGELGRERPGVVVSRSGVLGRYHVLACTLPSGGRVVSAWDDSRALSKSVRNLFSAFCRLADALLRGSRREML